VSQIGFDFGQGVSRNKQVIQLNRSARFAFPACDDRADKIPRSTAYRHRAWPLVQAVTAFAAISGVPTAAPTRTRTYADGRPFDELHYLQAKLLLKPNSLGSPDQFREFGRLVQRTARALKIGVVADRATLEAPQVREIVFGDTPDFRLYKNGFILRRRIRYVDGFPSGDPEIVFKFRDPNLHRAAALDIRPDIAGRYQIKFKIQALPLNDRIGGYRLLYSHNCQFGVSQLDEPDRTAMSTLARVFPALASLKKSSGERIRFVNEGIVEELLFPLGRLDFGKRFLAKSDVSIWRTRGDHKPIVGEYAFQVKFDDRGEVPSKTEKLVKEFFVTLQRDIEGWISLGTTKTGLVYRLKGHAIDRHE
jgi:hypothetical protein